MDVIHSILQTYWGYDKFRPLQEDIIRSVLEKKDTLALLPTGGGKSICFQVPAMAMEGICIVVSPLIALMKDQVENLKKRDIPALAVFSGMNRREIDMELDNCIHGRYKFVYVSPERLKSELFIERFKQMNVCLLAIDEAHCISQWGYDFRPEYLHIAEIRAFTKAPVLALTATATAKVVTDIQEKLNFSAPNIFRKSFERKNLSYVVLEEDNKLERILTIAGKIKGTGVIYARNRRLCKEIAEYLHLHGHSADFYHAGLEHTVRNRKQEAWIKGNNRIIVATNAFGMGIDKPDVRFVIHYEMPDSLEAYYQEAGRAGRDEKKAYCIALYTPKDKEEATRKIELSFPPYEEVSRIYDLLCNHFQIAMHSGLGVTVDFSITEFSQKYNLQSAAVYQALHILQQQEIIYLGEAFFQPAALHINVDNTVLYDFELRNPQIAGFIKLLLRTYGGLFDQYVRIDESYLARKAGVSLHEIQDFFKKLAGVNLLDYQPAKEQPQLSFLRVRENKLHYDQAFIRLRKKEITEKSEAVFDYAANKTRCRSRIILEYFDEHTAENCGVCDVCLEARQKEKADHKNWIISLIKKDIRSLKSILEQAGVANEEAVQLQVQLMLDEGILSFDDDHLLVWKEG